MKASLLDYLDKPVFPIALALYILGIFLKRTPKVPNWCIPWILLILSVVLTNLLLGISIPSVLQGVLACGVAVLGYELYKQARNGLEHEK